MTKQNRPTDKELERVYQAAYQPAWERGEFFSCHVDGLRAVLAHFAQPAIEPAPSSEVLPPQVEHILRLAEIIREVDGKHDKGAAALAEAILSHRDSRWQPRKTRSEPVVPTDRELDELFTEIDQSGVCQSWRGYARAVLARFVPSAAAPVSVADRLPDLIDCTYRNGDHWCWGQERSVLTGHGTARWTLMRISRIEEEAVAWLPHYALPLP